MKGLIQGVQRKNFENTLAKCSIAKSRKGKPRADLENFDRTSEVVCPTDLPRGRVEMVCYEDIDN